MDWGILILRTVFIFFFILIIMRLMGKREIGKLSIFDLIVSIMIAELAVISIDNLHTPMLHSLLPIIILFMMQILLAYVSLKSQKMRSIVDGKPSVLIEHGRIKESELKKQRYNLDDLLMQLREKHIQSISQVEFAILEPSGKLTVFPKEEHQPLTRGDVGFAHKGVSDLPVILIQDGRVQYISLEQIEQNVFWLKKELKRRTGTSRIDDIMFCSIDSDGTWYIDFKDDP